MRKWRLTGRRFKIANPRLPTLVWPRELPIEGAPPVVVKIVESYGEWLANSGLPKLFINAEPGAQLVGRMRDFCRNWPNQREVAVPGIHFIQEDSPHQIGAAIREFIGSIRG
jgi:haloalkane dehalogenase